MKRPRRSAADWKALVGECERSGLSRSAFAQREGIHPGTFAVWASRLAPRRAGSGRTAKVTVASGFVPVRVRSGAAHAAEVVRHSALSGGSRREPVEITLGNGRRVRFDLVHVADPRLSALLALAEGGRGC